MASDSGFTSAVERMLLGFGVAFDFLANRSLPALSWVSIFFVLDFRDGGMTNDLPERLTIRDC